MFFVFVRRIAAGMCGAVVHEGTADVGSCEGIKEHFDGFLNSNTVLIGAKPKPQA